MPASVTLKAKGLNISPNQLEVPPGSLTEAKNVIIKRDDVIEPRRGFKLFGDAFGTSSDRAKQLAVYKDRILRHFQNTLQFQNGTNNDGTDHFDSFSGNFTEVQPGLRFKSISAQGNFYFTTSDGIKKISAAVSGDLTSDPNYIIAAGGVKAVDFNAALESYFARNSGFLKPDSAVAYRIVWGIKDLNNNLILGTPSSRVEVFNSLNTTNINDYLRVLYGLDSINQTGSLINNGNYVETLKLDGTATASDLRAKLIALTSKIDNDIVYADNNSGGAPLQLHIVDLNTGICSVVFLASAKEKTTITTVPAVNLATSGTASYFTLNSANDATQYYIWYQLGTSTDPAIGGKTGIQVNLTVLDTDAQVATKTNTALGAFSANFTSSVSGNMVIVENTAIGSTTDAAPATSGFSIIVITQGGIHNNLTDYLSAGNQVYLDGFTSGTGTLNGAQTITTVSSTSALEATYGNINNVNDYNNIANYTLQDPTKVTVSGGQAKLKNNLDSFVTLLVHADGINGSSTFTDTSASAHTLTANNGAVITTASKQFGTGSMNVNASNSSVSIPNGSDFAFGTGDFTVEGWFNNSNWGSGAKGMIAAENGTTGRWSLEYSPTSGQGIRWASGNGTGTSYASGTDALMTTFNGNWVHVAVSRSSGTIRIFINGTQYAAAADVYNYSNTTGNLYVGYREGNNTYFSGLIDEVRISKGVARYTSNFTPPTNSFDTYNTSQSWYVTTGASTQVDLSTMSLVTNCNITYSEPANTKVRGLISFDNRNTWKKWNGSAWIFEINNSDLATYDFTTNGNTVAQIQTGLTNLSTQGLTTLDVVFGLSTTNDLTTPNVDVVTLTYDGPYSIVTGTTGTNVKRIPVELFTFNTTATGTATMAPTATVVDNTYRSIPQPSTVSFLPTHAELASQQTYLDNIITQLQSENSFTIPTLLLNQFIVPLAVTSSSAVKLDITIPQDVTVNHFYQIYRSAQVSATGVTVLSDLTPSDELQLVIEAFPTTAELAAKKVIVEDITPEEFRAANLYTNPSTGEGILQANDVPPLSKDMNRFKGYTFYANTSTRHRKSLALLGVSKLLRDYNSSIIPKLVISSSSGRNIYSFIKGVAQTTQITCLPASSLVSSASAASYFLINSANNSEQYYVWYKLGSSLDPVVSGRTGVQVNLVSGDTNTIVAQKTRDALAQLDEQFISSSSSNIVTVVNFSVGYTASPQVGTSGFTINVTVPGLGEKASQSESSVTCVADVSGNLASKYFTLNDTYNDNQYYIWFKVSGTGSDPAISGKIGLLVNLITNDSAITVATKIKTALDTLTGKFTTSRASNVLDIKNFRYGPANAATAGNSGFTVATLDSGALNVLLSDEASSAISVDETARSLTNIINTNQTEQVYSYYLSGTRDVPGKMLIEARSLGNPAFYIEMNISNSGSSFNPDLSPELTITSISTGSPTSMLVTTNIAHGLINQDSILIAGSNSIPNIDGLNQITYVSPTSFRINKNIVTSGNTGGAVSSLNSIVSDNETKPNRVYYSKFQQTEAVPILNYLDVGAEDKKIIRIFPLRDSLFVFKEDGLFRISGEVAPFNLALFDSSCIVNAPDSVSVSNNLIYAWTTQGISTVSESGITVISRPIDTEILKLPLYTNFSTATWGIGYESDQAYLVWTVKNLTDTEATICYRYGALTNSWTTFDKTNPCGVVSQTDNKIYLGAGDSNKLEQERKDFTRSDYSDREFSISLSAGNYFGTNIKVNNISNVEPGDVLFQEQLLTVYRFNALLKKLDLDSGVNQNDYYSTLKIKAGEDLRIKLVALAQKLDTDTGVAQNDFFSTIDVKSGSISGISVANPTVLTATSHGMVDGRIVNILSTDSSPSIDGNWLITLISSNSFSIDKEVTSPGTSGTYTTVVSDPRDIKACYNAIINKLNVDPQIAFSNYTIIDTKTDLEAVILAVNSATKQITVNLALDYVVGTLTVYKAINSEISWSPNTMGDPVGLKQVREATLMFMSKAFTNAILSFASDLLPAYIDIPFNGDGNGIFGIGSGNFGDNFFGGGSHAAPFRTYIPADCQRCRFLLARFKHNIAREAYGIYGLSLVGEVGLSSRAYR